MPAPVDSTRVSPRAYPRPPAHRDEATLVMAGGMRFQETTLVMPRPAMLAAPPPQPPLAPPADGAMTRFAPAVVPPSMAPAPMAPMQAPVAAPPSPSMMPALPAGFVGLPGSAMGGMGAMGAMGVTAATPAMPMVGGAAGAGSPSGLSPAVAFALSAGAVVVALVFDALFLRVHIPGVGGYAWYLTTALSFGVAGFGGAKWTRARVATVNTVAVLAAVAYGIADVALGLVVEHLSMQSALFLGAQGLVIGLVCGAGGVRRGLAGRD